MYLRDFLALKPFHDYSLCSVCILPQPAFYSQSAVCIIHTVCILPLVCSPQSAVHSPQSTFYTDRKKRLRNLLLQVKKGGVLSYTYNKMVGSPPYVLWWWFLLWQLLLIIFFSLQVAKGIKTKLYTPQLYAGQLHKVEASLHCPNTAAPHPQVSFP